MTTNPIIEFKNIGIQFKSQAVHKDISFSIRSGEAVTILGPSGVGKTLLLKMIIGLLYPDKGELLIFNRNLNDISKEEILKLRSEIGMLFQGAALFDSLSVFENIAYSLREREDFLEAKIQEIVHEKLEIVGLPEIDQKFPPQLSGGQKKRVGLARALASSPKVMLFDEPTTGLDPTATRLIDELIYKLNDEFKMTCISVTHDIASAERISNRWILLHGGTVVADGEASDLKNSNEFIQTFINGTWKE